MRGGGEKEEGRTGQAFDGPLLESLLELDLSDNALGQVPQTGVPSLKSLRKLYLNRNRISSLPPNAFNNYESKNMLLKLELAENRIPDLGANTVFNALTNLEELSLEANLLSRVPTEALRAQRGTLTDLNLGLNNINNVPAGSLQFPELKSLSLEFNGIVRLPGESLRGLPKLLYLYLTGNKFPNWDPAMFQYVPSLQILGIGETPIRVIPANAFTNIRRLIRLEMTEAAVDTIERGAFQMTPQIQAIILNRNRLKRFASASFSLLLPSRLFHLSHSDRRPFSRGLPRCVGLGRVAVGICEGSEGGEVGDRGSRRAGAGLPIRGPISVH